MTTRHDTQHEYDYQCDILDPNTGRAIIQDYSCILIVEDFDRAAGTIDIHDVYSTDGLRLLEGGALAKLLRAAVISQAKNDKWLIDAVFARNEDEDSAGVWAKADRDYAERAGK